MEVKTSSVTEIICIFVTLNGENIPLVEKYELCSPDKNKKVKGFEYAPLKFNNDNNNNNFNYYIILYYIIYYII